MKYFIFFMLLCIGEQIPVQIIGTINITDIFIVIYFILNFCFSKNNRTRFFIDNNINTLCYAYLALFLCTLCTELLVQNRWDNSLKGIAVIVLSFIKVCFLWQLFDKRENKIFLYIICLMISYLLFTSPEEEASVSEIISGEAFSFFKFKIAPRIGEGLVVLSLISQRRKKTIALNFTFVGAICIILGARSTGLMIMLTGVLGNIILNDRTVSSKTILKWSIPTSIVLYGFYVAYINAVLSGTIIGGNSHFQVPKTVNPYNPINVLLAGRSEFPASTSAIIDKPLTGHGAWANDPGWKYHLIALNFADEEYNKQKELMATDIIPAHSIILGTGVNNGIFAMGIMIFIITFVIRCGWKSLFSNSPYLFLVIFSIMQLVWNGLFSPISHFRGMFPFYFVCCLLSYRYSKQMKIT